MDGSEHYVLTEKETSKSPIKNTKEGFDGIQKINSDFYEEENTI
ncbi:MAG: hypothetical protein ACTSXJ_06160 [Candidatus Baldrarchaeia archaeon]